MTKSPGPVKFNRPALFDWFVFILSFSMGFIFPTLGAFVESNEFSWWMLVTLILYVAGTWLKHIPLSYRLANGSKKREVPWMLFLLTGHWCIMLLLIILAQGAVFRLLGMKTMMEKGAQNGWFIAFTMVFSIFITWLVYREKKLPRSFKLKSSAWLARREIVADLFLIISVSILTYVLWEKGIMALLSNKAVSSFREVWFLFIMLSITYVLLYLPLRYLYLVEDHSSRQTWKRILLIFAFLLLRSLFEILQIT